MAFFKRLFGGGTDKKKEAPKQADECRHTGQLAPRWDNIDDIGKNGKIAGYVCQVCRQYLTLEEAAQAKQQ